MIAKQVLRFEITMKIVVLMHVSKALHSLKHDVSDLVLREESFPFLHELVHVHIEILKNEVKDIFLQDNLV